MKINKFIYLVISITIIISVFYFRNVLLAKFVSPTTSQIPTGVQIEEINTFNNNTTETNDRKDFETIVENLKIPWDLAFLPNGEMLVTERPGDLLKIGKDKNVIEIDGVTHIGEGGLLGLALDPKFSENKFIYLYLTTGNKGSLENRVERYKLDNNSLIDKKIIISEIKGSSNHDGGRIAFGPDGYLYITTGDAENSALAQDTKSLNGKILRVDNSGKFAPDNPFGNATYSYGHRNVQGLAWDEKDNLWATEHGPSGIQTGNDEINLIKKGGNYGWPLIKGSETKDGLASPIVESGKKDTWAPSGILYFRGSLFFAGLRGEALYQAKIVSDSNLELLANFKKQFGRIRTITIGPDGYFYILTNNTDGRGTPKAGDDKVIRINPDIFFK